MKHKRATLKKMTLAALLLVLSLFLLPALAEQTTGETGQAGEAPQNLTLMLNWVGDEGKTELRGDKVEVSIKKNGDLLYPPYSVKKEDNWKTTLQLPLVDSDGAPYDYALNNITTMIWPAYIVTDSRLENGVLTITLTHQPTVDIDAALKWDDDNDINGQRPQTLNPTKIKLHDNPNTGNVEVQADSMEKNEDGSWTLHFKNVPTSYTDSNGVAKRVQSYAIDANDVDELKPFYSAQSSDRSNHEEGTWYSTKVYLLTATLQAIKVKANYELKSYLNSFSASNDDTAWKHAQSQGIEVPETVTMTLLSDGKIIGREDATVTYQRDGKGAFPTMEKTWFLPKYDANGSVIDYGELSVDYSPKQDAGLDGAYVQKCTVSNNEKNYDIKTIIPGIGSVSMPVVWNDDSNALNVRPNTLSATLLADGKPVGEATTLKVNEYGPLTGYPEAWKGLPQRSKNGKYIHYTFQLNDLPAYYDAQTTENPTYNTPETGYNANGSSQTYVSKVEEKTTFTLKTQTAKATIKREGDVGSEKEMKQRPAAAKLKLQYTDDDGKTWKPFWGAATFAAALGTEPNEWTYEWSGLPQMDAAGKAIRYRVVPANESAVYKTQVEDPVYKTDNDGKVHSEFVIHQAYNDNWNYTIDLKWNKPTPAEQYDISSVTTGNVKQTVQYTLSISVQKPYKARALEVRIPYELFDRRSGDRIGTVVNRFGIGSETNPTSERKFTYRIDDKGTKDTTDDEVVFYNYKDLSASENFSTNVEYIITPGDVVDCSIGKLTAIAKGQYDGQTEPEVQQSGPITYRVDTGVSVSSFRKSNPTPVYSWNTEFGSKPDDFNVAEYNYVEYTVSGVWSWNQPNTITFVEKPGDGGVVYKIWHYYGDSGLVDFKFDSNLGGYTWKGNLDGAGRVGTAYKVLVRYPRNSHDDPLHPGQKTYETDYHNDVEVQLMASDEHPDDKGKNDQNDVAIAQGSSAMHWVDYTFSYDGELVSQSKSMYPFPSGALTALKYGGNAEADCSVSMTVNGYNLANGYSMELMDDAAYLCATINGKATNYVRLTENDYEFSGMPYISITLTGVDRTNGQKVPGKVPADPFILWGRKGNAGEWEEISRVVMTNPEERFKLDEIGGKGYTALRVTSPNDLEDKAQIYIYSFQMRLFSASPAVQRWLNQDGLTQMVAQNVAAFNVYANDGQDNMTWANPYQTSSNWFAKKQGLDAEDKKRLGAYQLRTNDSSSLFLVKEESGMKKISRVEEWIDSPEDQTLTIPFTIYEWEELDRADLPQAIYDEKNQTGAVIYDLMPVGFNYATDKDTQVYGATDSFYNSIPIGARNAVLSSVETIDNYKGTGRQMVIFKIKSNEPEKKNAVTYINYWYTGFGVRFYARAGYNDLINGVKQYNIAAAQREDLKAIAGGFTERGWGDDAQSSEKIFPLDENKQRVFYDVNGDSVVNGDTNTLYSFVEFTPNVVISAENGLTKTVKGVSGQYKKDDIANLDSRYFYRLELRAQKGGEISNVVLYDILEKAANTGNATGEPDGWKGAFAGVNTYLAKQLWDVEPKVLYSTEKDLSYNDPDKLLIENNGTTRVWSETPPDDLSTVTAVAFDLRKKTDGSDFVLAEEQNVSVEIIMRAPDKLQPSEYAYNRPAYNSTYKTNGGHTAATSFNIAGRTTLKLHDLQSLEFIKQYVNDAGELAPLLGAQFKLYRCSNTDANHEHGKPGISSACWGTAIRTTTSMADGKVRFGDLDTGTYAITETQTPTGVKLLNCYWVFDVDATKGTVSAPEVKGSNDRDPLVPMEKEGDQPYTLLNQRLSVNIQIEKNWSDDANKLIRPKTLTFDLYRTNKNGKQYDEGGKPYRTATVTISEKQPNEETFSDVFTDLPGFDDNGEKFIYKVVEHVPEGYQEANGGEATVEYEYGGSMTLKVTFTNNRLGVLDIKKVVENTDTTKAFGFTVTLTDKDDKALTGSVFARRFTTDASTYSTETLTIGEEGKLSVSIAPGETLRLIGLPLGAKWKVTEASGSYTVKAAVDSVEKALDLVSGTVSSTTKPSVVFTNTPKAATLELNVTKEITGKTNSDETFTFTLTGKDGAPMPQNSTVAITGAGNKNFAPITFTNVGTYVYEVTEVKGNASGYTYDDSTYTVTVVVTDQDGQLTAAKTVKKGDAEVQALTFTNTYTAKGSLSLTATKTVNGETPRDDQTFDFELKNGADTPVVSQTKQNAKGTVTFDVLNYTQDDAGKTYTYIVKEAPTDKAGYTADKTEYTVSVTITDNGNGTLNVTPTYKIGKETAIGMSFNNTYKATGSLTLTATKTVNGKEPNEKQTFEFKLQNKAGTRLADQTKQNAKGMVTFDKIEYTEADAGRTYKYEVLEATPDGNGYTVDQTVYTVEVAVTDNRDGTLSVTPTYKIGENVVPDISFKNRYEATGSLTLTASKTVNGKKPTEKQKYNFELRSGDYSQTKQNVGGTVTFDSLNYTQDDAGNTYVYTVKETTQSADGLTADPTVYTIEVKVEDNYNGTLSITPTYYIGEGESKKQVEADENGGLPVKFENRLIGSVVLSKTVEGGTPEEGETFAFTCFFEDENGQPLTEQFAYCDEKGNQLGVVGHEGTLALKAGESVVIEGLPVGTICTIAEESVSPRYTTTVNKEETSEIKLNVEALKMPATFVNKMATTGFKVTKVWQDGNEGAISLTLYANGQKMEPQPACNRSGDTYTYAGLPMYDVKGNPIQYAAKERPVSGYMTIYKNVAPYESESSFIYDGGTIINRAVTQIAVRKVWTGMDKDEKRPEITLTLYRNGKVVNRKPKLDANGWYHFYNLPINSEPYYVVETPVNGFMTTYQNVGGYANVEDRAYDGGTITNSKLPQTGDESHIERYVALLLISLVALLGYGLKKKRDQ